MADWNKPALSDTYSNFLSYLNDKIKDAGYFNSPDVTTIINPYTGMKRWNVANDQFEIYNGTTWVALTSTRQKISEKDATGGYVGLTLFKINFKNAANTFTSFFANANTAARTYTFQDRDGTIADNTDISAAISTAAGDATTKANAATAVANGAQSTANTATAVANEAQSTANTALVGRLILATKITTSTSAWAKQAGTNKIVVTGIGGGGGGGSGGTESADWVNGGGGGVGGYPVTTVSDPLVINNPAATYPITIGAGGNGGGGPISYLNYVNGNVGLNGGNTLFNYNVLSFGGAGGSGGIVGASPNSNGRAGVTSIVGFHHEGSLGGAESSGPNSPSGDNAPANTGGGGGGGGGHYYYGGNGSSYAGNGGNGGSGFVWILEYT